MNDETFVNNVRRGEFRLHPKGPLGLAAFWLLGTPALSLLLLRLFYTTPLGTWFAELFPRSFWDSYLDWYGRADGESGQDGELVAFAALSLALAMMVTSAAVVLAVRWQRVSASRA